MKKYIFLYTLFLFHNCVAIGADRVDLNQVRQLSTKLFDQAQENISPQLHACTNLKDIETLLYNEERDALDAYFTACQVPKLYQDEFHTAFAESIQNVDSYPRRLFSYLKSPPVVHDKTGISAELMKEIKNILSQYNLNSSYINIARNDEYFKTNPDAAACAMTSGFLIENPLKIIINR